MTEAEALDLAAKAAGWGSWEYVKTHCDPGERPSILAHAKTIMELAKLTASSKDAAAAMQVALASLEKRADYIAALKAENEQLTAILSEMNDTDVVARTMAENERLREALEQLSAVELTLPADRIRDDDHVIITYKTFRALRTTLERIDHGNR